MTARVRSADVAAQEWKGPWRRYDILKEGVVAIVVGAAYFIKLAFDSEWITRSIQSPSLVS